MIGVPFNQKENWCEVQNKDAPGCAASRYDDYWYDWVDLSREALPDEKEFEKTCLAQEKPRCEIREGVCRGRPRVYICPACLGEQDPILWTDIVSDPVCAHGKCYGASSLAKTLQRKSEIPHSRDPYTLSEFLQYLWWEETKDKGYVPGMARRYLSRILPEDYAPLTDEH